jgi:hypothetical protein
MTISLYDVSIPALVRGLVTTSALLDKAAAYAESKKFDAASLVHSRLFPDMHPLSSQVQIACDTAKGAAGRLARVEIPKHADTETTLPELKARIAKTVDFLNSITPAQLAGDDTRSIEMKNPNNVWKFTAVEYVTKFVLPNFYFHISMVYALLREGGVEVGKRDFLGAIQ